MDVLDAIVREAAAAAGVDADRGLDAGARHALRSAARALAARLCEDAELLGRPLREVAALAGRARGVVGGGISAGPRPGPAEDGARR